MVSGRPRRSAVPATYQTTFPNLSDSEGEETGDQQDGKSAGSAPENGAGNGVSSASRGQGHGNDEDGEDEDMDSASGSEYAPEVIKGKDGTAEVAESEESEIMSEGVPEDEDDDDSAAGEDDLSIAGSELIGDEIKGPGKQLKYGRGRVSFVKDTTSALPTTPAPLGPSIKIASRTPTAVLQASAGLLKRAVSKRKPIGDNNNRKPSVHDLQYTSSYLLPRFVLTSNFDDPIHGNPMLTSDSSGVILEDEDPKHARRLRNIKRVSYLPFGPQWDLMEDYSWAKGKWVEGSGENGQRRLLRSEKWGGWYPDIKPSLNDFNVIGNLQDILPYLPRNAFPALPQMVHLECDTEAPNKDEDNEADLFNFPPDTGNEMREDPVSDRTGNERSNANPILRAALAEPAQSVVRTSVRSQEREDDGIVRLRLGTCGDIVAGIRSIQSYEVTVALERFQSVRLDKYLTAKPGFLFNTGGAVSGLDWCPLPDDAKPTIRQYLAVATVSEQPVLSYRKTSKGDSRGLLQIWSLDTTISSDFSYQTDVNSKGAGVRLDLAMPIEAEVLQLRWCPRGGAQEGSTDENAMDVDGTAKLERLGLLAVLGTDGTLGIYDIPYPESVRRASSIQDDDLVFIKPKSPLLKLELGTIVMSAVAWMSHTRIAVGCTTGSVAIFDIEDALLAGAKQVTPIHYIRCHDTAITSIAIFQEPRLPSDKSVDVQQEDPVRFVTASNDGSCRSVNLLDWANVHNYGHERAIRNVVTYQPATGGLLFADQELGVRLLYMRVRDLGASTRVNSHNGPVMDIACSDFHPFHAAASADGICSLGNTVRRIKRAGHSAHFLTKLYRMDFNRKTGELRMIDNILPDARINHESRSARGGGGSKKKQSFVDENGQPLPDTLSTVAWPSEVCINRVAWCRSIRKAQVLASGMACGLVRIDITTGPWSTEASESVKATNAQDEEDDSDD